MSIDPLLDPSNDRFVLFPIKYPQFWDFYKKTMSCFWTVEELDFAGDLKDWQGLSHDEKHFIKHVLAFFAASDGIVNENINMNFSNEITVPEIRAIYTFQSFMESIHCVSPSTLILTDKGYFKIKELCYSKSSGSDPIRVWNGKEFSEVRVQKTSDSASLYRVRLSNGMELDCTDEHKWLIKGADGSTERVMTKNLKTYDMIADFKYPIIDIPDPDSIIPDFEQNDNLFVPLNYPINTMLRWLEYKTQDGFMICHKNKEYIKQFQLLVTSLGASCVVEIEEDFYTLRFSQSEIDKLHSLGFVQKRALISGEDITYELQKLYVMEVIDLQTKSETYCFNEPKEHAGVFNGILTGQSETYSLLIDTYIKDEDEKKHLLKAIETIPIIKKKAEWAMKWFSRDAPFCNRLVAFAAVEGIFFSGSFCAIYWLKKRGLMLSGLCTSNEFISRDENMHTQTAVMIHKTLQPENQCSIEMITEIIKSAVAIEEEFVCDALPVSLIGMNSAAMCQYIHFVADRLLEDLGAPKVWNEGCPFEWMQLLGLNGKTNFFEKRVSEYSRAGVGVDRDEQVFTLDADF